jgi:hypothetical protein
MISTLKAEFSILATLSEPMTIDPSLNHSQPIHIHPSHQCPIFNPINPYKTDAASKHEAL